MGRSTMLWGIEQEEIKAMKYGRCNEIYLPGVKFPDSLQVTTNIDDALMDSEDVLIVVPSHALRETLGRLKASSQPIKHLSWATKGFETETGLLPHQVVEQVMGTDLPVAVISGPTFASEVAAGLPSAVSVASTSENNAYRLAQAISTDTFRAYTAKDMIGVEVGGATKNVLAIGAGISDGLGFRANTRIAMMTRGLIEMTRLGVALGAQKDTFIGLSGMGDLVLTCSDDQSRNRRFGLGLADGATIEDLRKTIGQVVEGYYAARAVHKVAKKLGVDMPIVEQIYKVLYEHLAPEEAVANLLKRPLTIE
jgi:glycerol-3-phosphate dehydrogenase (NAD(P)+)